MILVNQHCANHVLPRIVILSARIDCIYITNKVRKKKIQKNLFSFFFRSSIRVSGASVIFNNKRAGKSNDIQWHFCLFVFFSSIRPPVPSM
jgi:hypothetical protein